MELAGSTLNGLPPAISLEEITTVWPCLLSEYESVSEATAGGGISHAYSLT
jgi:hypothetical protein